MNLRQYFRCLVLVVQLVVQLAVQLVVPLVVLLVVPMVVQSVVLWAVRMAARVFLKREVSGRLGYSFSSEKNNFAFVLRFQKM